MEKVKKKDDRSIEKEENELRNTTERIKKEFKKMKEEQGEMRRGISEELKESESKTEWLIWWEERGIGETTGINRNGRYQWKPEKVRIEEDY